MAATLQLQPYVCVWREIVMVCVREDLAAGGY